MLCRQSAFASVGARHVSAEGCQFVIDCEMPTKGERFAFSLDERITVAGTVSWVVKDRIGFAFDCPIGQDLRTALLAQGRGHQGIEIYQLHA